MKIRRIIAAVMALAIIFSLGACGETQKDVITTTEPISVETQDGKTFTFEVSQVMLTSLLCHSQTV